MKWHIFLIIVGICRIQSRFIRSENCTNQKGLFSEDCILKCVELLYHRKDCLICNFGIDFSSNYEEKENILVEKSMSIVSELCLECANGRVHEKSEQNERSSLSWFQLLNMNLCIKELKIHSNLLTKLLKDSERKNHRVRRAHAPYINRNAHSNSPVNYFNEDPLPSFELTDRTKMLLIVFLVIFIVIVLMCICKFCADDLRKTVS